MNLKPAHAELKMAQNMVRTNEPFNRRIGNIKQANLERENGKSFKDAMAILRRHIKMMERPK